jgi:hypothetical protein
MTVHQLLAARIAETSLPAVAAEIGISDQDLRGFMIGIALAAMPAERVRAWSAQYLPAAEPVVAVIPRPAEHDHTPAPDPAPARKPRRDAGWGFVRTASGEEVGLPPFRPRRRPAPSPRRTASAASRAGVDVEKIREFARRRVEDSSLRAVLAEIGPPLQRGSLHQFLNGSTPREPVLTHLAAWHERAAAEQPEEADAAWREVPVPILRAYYAAEVERVGSHRAVRRAAGVSIKALQDFLAGKTSTQPRVLRKLARLYLSRNGRLSDPKPAPTPKPKPEPKQARQRPRHADRRPTPPSRPGRGARLDEDEPDAPWRAVPVATLRTYVAAEVRQLGSKPAFARAAGVQPKALRNFLEERTEPRPWVLRAFALYYLAKGGQLSEQAPPRVFRARGRRAERPPAPQEPASYPFAFPADEIREYIWSRVERSSLRFVSTEIHEQVGVARATVEGFLDGSTALTERSAERLMSWYSDALVRMPISPDQSTEHRRVPLDELHRFYTDAVERTSARAVARKAGVGYGAFRHFLARTGRLQARTRRNLGQYYLARKGVPEDPEPRVGPEKESAAGSPAPAPARPAAPPQPELTPEQRRINTIRAYARLRAAAKTARVIANEVGLNFSTFYNFLRGNDPIPRIRGKLEAWYDRDSATAEGAATLRDQMLGEGEGDAAARAASPAALRTFYAAALTRGTTSLRALAGEVGVGATALKKFLDGAPAKKEMLSRLQAYYADHSMKRVAALDALLEDLDGYVRTRARRRVLSSLARGYKEARLPTPGWVELLVAQPL